MKVNGKHYRTIWVNKDDPKIIEVIDQRHLPHEFVIEQLTSLDDVFAAIRDMHVRGAGLIGVTAAYGVYLATIEASTRQTPDIALAEMTMKLLSARPTAVNLEYAVQRQLEAIRQVESYASKINIAFATANDIAEEDANACRQIGQHGLQLIRAISKEKKKLPVNILTHCNAGWLAFVDYGSATAPIYAAWDEGIDVHVWVDETRPRNQGARLTAWELGQHGVPHTVIPDNTGGHLMQKGLVDLVLTGTDRTTYTGDVANKIGTYLKALAAYDNNIPFYVALPSSSFDWHIRDGLKEIKIEERNPDEVTIIHGLYKDQVVPVRLTPEGSKAVNYAFDVTPSRLVTGLITERGICGASEAEIMALFPERSP